MTLDEVTEVGAKEFIEKTKKEFDELGYAMSIIRLYEKVVEELVDTRTKWHKSIATHKKDIEKEVKKHKALQKKHQLLKAEKGRIENKLYTAEKALNKAAARPMPITMREVIDDEKSLILKLEQYIYAREHNPGETRWDGWLATLQTVVNEAKKIRDKRDKRGEQA